MRPSRGAARPRTVTSVGRPVRATANFSPRQAVTSGPRSSSSRRAKAGPNSSSSGGKLPGLAMRGKSAVTAATASPRTKPGTTTNANGAAVTGAARTASRSRVRMATATLRAASELSTPAAAVAPPGGQAPAHFRRRPRGFVERRIGPALDRTGEGAGHAGGGKLRVEAAELGRSALERDDVNRLAGGAGPGRPVDRIG